MKDLAYLGQGMKFPPQIDNSTGRFTLSAGYDNIKESIYIILMTQRGERWIEPGFGANMMSYTFMDTSLTMLNLMADEVRSCIINNEPRVVEVEVNIDSEMKNGCLLIGIRYMVAASHQRDSMVFPFYLNAVEEEENDEARE